jgi:hypothetical protein
MSLQQLLTASARVEPTESDYQRLAQIADNITDWGDLPAQAEEQSLAPLLYTHLQTAGATMPRHIKRELLALYLRHQHAHRVHTEALHDILTAFESAGIQALILKGAALSFLIYPQANLRPKRDIDILVKSSEARPAQKLLQDLGFNAPLPDVGDTLPDKHLAAATRKTQGMSTSIEIHHNLFNIYYPVSMTITDLTAAPLPFVIDVADTQMSAYTLGYEDMLWHLCQHVAYHANVWEPIRLVWVADIIGFAERFVTQIDWQRISYQYPLVLNTLSLLHFITPLSSILRHHAPLKIGECPAGIGTEFQGWPRSSLAHQRDKGYGRVLYDTFFPSEWWLRLHYGLDSAQPLFWYRWMRHPIHIFGRLRQYAAG